MEDGGAHPPGTSTGLSELLREDEMEVADYQRILAQPENAEEAKEKEEKEEARQKAGQIVSAVQNKKSNGQSNDTGQFSWHRNFGTRRKQDR